MKPIQRKLLHYFSGSGELLHYRFGSNISSDVFLKTVDFKVKLYEILHMNFKHHVIYGMHKLNGTNLD